MSENGPYNQPPQNPYGGGDGTGGQQPPYGQPQGGPYGDPGTGGQPGYGQGPYPGAPGPGMPGPGGPGPDQGMYAGGQPPYGPGPGGYPPAPQPQGGGGKAGMWVVIGGGVVIVVLVIAVVIMLVTNGNRGDEVAAGADETSETTDEEPAEEEEPQTNEGGGTLGDPPHALPVEPCDAFTEQVQTDFLLRDSGSKYVSDNSANCSNTAESPEGNPEEAFGYLDVEFKLPYSASDSPEAAAEDIESTLQRLRGDAESDRYSADDVEEEKAIEGLGDEAHYVSTKFDMLDEMLPEATLLVRADNLVIKVTYYLDNIRGDKDDLELPANTEEIMVNAANEAIGIVGS